MSYRILFKLMNTDYFSKKLWRDAKFLGITKIVENLIVALMRLMKL